MKIRDVQKIHVESGIPMPAKKSLRVTRRKWHKELSKMNPNDSFVVAKAARPSVYQAARNLGIEVESREIDTYHVRVFVVGKKDNGNNNLKEDPIPELRSRRHRPNQAILI